MFQYLFFCCSNTQKDQHKTVSLEDININNPLITKNTSNNNITQSNNNCLFTETNNYIKINEEKHKENEKEENDNIIDNENRNIGNDKNEEIINENTVFKSPVSETHILTINNINNININFHSEDKLKTSIKYKDENEMQKNLIKSSEQIPKIKKIKTQDKENYNSRENSKEKNKSFISFSNITIKYNNGIESSFNLSDTEILASCELTLTGELFFNKEIKIDRSCIKNSGVRKIRSKKACEIKFGLAQNGGESKTIGNNNVINEEKNGNKSGNKNSNIKNSKISTIKTKQKKKLQSLSSFSSMGNNAFNNKNIIDILLDLPFNKVQKKINESNNKNNVNKNNNNNNNNENIILFILKYDLNLDLFQLISTQDCLPVQLLLNYNFPLKFLQNYFILVGGVKVKIRVNKNEKNESIINIYVYSNNNNNNDKKKSLKYYTFNSLKDKMPITIGRNTCNINLDNISVSKVHAQIDYIYEYDEFFIIDCNSTNGTYLLLQSPENSLYLKQDLNFKLCESNFRIYYTNFEK